MLNLGNGNNTMNSSLLTIFLSIIVSALAQRGCSICGEGKIVSKPDAKFDFFLDGEIIHCGTLEESGKQGLISLERCHEASFLLDEICGCVSIEDTNKVGIPKYSEHIIEPRKQESDKTSIKFQSDHEWDLLDSMENNIDEYLRSAQNPSGEIGTCGNGKVGNNICSDGKCCSWWGYCGTSHKHCSTSMPSLAPISTRRDVNTSNTIDTNQEELEIPQLIESSLPFPLAEYKDSRMVAYLGNWNACPTEDQWSQYSHIVIAFATAYTWNNGPICTDGCYIPQPPICNNRRNEALVQSWHDAGKKVLLGFGGATMGGSWEEPPNGCWEGCFGKEEYVVDQLVNHVNELGLDGIDFDYEYYYENDQGNSGFSKGAEAQNFIREVTEGLREKLPLGAILTHAPMDADLVQGTAYYNILRDIAERDLDFLMPQYYNGITRPILDGINGTGFGSVDSLSHYTLLVDDLFGGDATKVVFGFCIADCAGNDSNAIPEEGSLIMSQLSYHYPCNGGAFFWVVEHDVEGNWSRSVNSIIQTTAGCSNEMETYSPTDSLTSIQATDIPTRIDTGKPTNIFTVTPIVNPTSIPTTNLSETPTILPTESPTKIPTLMPTIRPSATITITLTEAPTGGPTRSPIKTSTFMPTISPTKPPTYIPSEIPTSSPIRSLINTSFEPVTNIPSDIPLVTPSEMLINSPVSQIFKSTESPTINHDKDQINIRKQKKSSKKSAKKSSKKSGKKSNKKSGKKSSKKFKEKISTSRDEP